jgi:hypothetical protein
MEGPPLMAERAYFVPKFSTTQVEAIPSMFTRECGGVNLFDPRLALLTAVVS